MKFSALRREVHLQNEDGSVSEEIKERTYDLKSRGQGRMIQVSIPASVPLKEFDYNAEVELINPVADTVATATFQGAEVDWYIKADDIVLKKGAAMNPQPPKKDTSSVKYLFILFVKIKNLIYEKEDFSMKPFFPRGKRIRPTDKDLVFHTALAALFPVFLLVVLLFHIRQIAGTNWQEVSLSQITQDVNLPYLLFSMGVAGLVCLTAVLLFWRYRRDEVKQLIHRQKLARMVLENKWYESEQRKEDAFFKDLSSSRSKETITYFPKIYYRMKQGLLHIRVEITLGKYQEQLLNLEKKLESGLYCELTDKELKDSYVEYTLLYDTIANRISIEDVQAKDGRLRLMENVWWEYDKLPHMLIAGGTGGGKTYFILTLIEALLRTNAVLFVLDPKNADLADLQAVMPDVHYKKEDMLSCIDRFYEEMMKRSENMKLMENYRTGENYAYLGLPANFLIFDDMWHLWKCSAQKKMPLSSTN